MCPIYTHFHIRTFTVLLLHQYFRYIWACLPIGVAQRSEVDVFSGVCQFVCLSINTITFERLHVRWRNLAVRCSV